jgi:putative ABC transport system permease protein
MSTPLRWLRRRFARDNEWREEIESHLEMRQEWNQAQGMPKEEARRMAQRQLGNALGTLERVRAVHVCGWLESLWQDIRYAARGFRRSPSFSVVAIATIAIGIAAAAAVFSAIDPLLFRRLPYPKDDQLISLGYFGPIDDVEFNVLASYLEWRERQTVFQSITSMKPGGTCDLQIADTPRQVSCYGVEANFLKTFGLAPVLGRDLTRDDDRPGAPTVALISYAIWRNQFGGDPGIVGQRVTLDEEQAPIIGVLPQEFEMPQLGDADVLIAARSLVNRPRADNASAPLRTFARLREGVSIERAREAMRPIFEDTVRQDAPYELRSELRLVVRSLRDRQIHDVKLASWMLLGAVLALLLVACANLANLLLARAAARRRELIVRVAIGTGRGRLIRQTMTESLLLGLIGGAAGCAIAWPLLGLFVRLAPEGLMRLNQARIDLRVLLFALVACLASALLFGAAPAFEPARAEALAGWQAAGSIRTFVRKALVAAQVAISLVLLSGASLFVRSLWKLENQSFGFQPEPIVTASFTLRQQRYRPPAVQAAFFREIESRLERIPGAGSFALSDSMPPSGAMITRPYSNMRIAGHPPVATNGGMVAFRWVTPGYFNTMGIAIVSGRDFTDPDRTGSDSPLILSATLARRLFGNENPVGQKIDLDQSGHWLPVVGVAADVKNSGLAKAAEPEYYRLRMNGGQPAPRNAIALFRTSFDPATLTRWIRREFAAIDPTLPVTIETMKARIGRLTDRPRFVALLVTLFAAIALLLAAVGLYGVLSFLVTQQTREIGVRMAVGARPRDVALQFQRRAGAWAGAGLIVGAGGSLAAARLVRGLLFEVTPADPGSLSLAVIVLAGVAALAAWAPARRAARVDPIVALRHD